MNQDIILDCRLEKKIIIFELVGDMIGEQSANIQTIL